MTKHRTLAEAHAENAKECAQIGHSWIATHPNGPRVLCSWCGAHRQAEEPRKGLPELIEAARQEKAAAESVKAFWQAPGPEEA